VFGIALAILAGHFLADYVREGLPRSRPLSSLAAASALLAVVGSAVLFSARTGHALDAAREAAIAAAIMLAAALILFGARRPSARAVAAGLVTSIAIAELLWWNAASRLNAQAEISMPCLRRRRVPRPPRSRCSNP